ncbi:MAG TPA: zinc ribbon domain-containing protein [Ktedonobacteraceae bacterium]
MQCPKCQARIDDDTIFCGNCGQQIAPLQARGATMNYASDEQSTSQGAHARISPPRFTPGTPTQPAHRSSETPAPATLPGIASSRQRGRPALLILAVGLLVLLAGGTFLTIGLLKNRQAVSTGGLASNASGQVSFFDGPNGSDGTDALRITISGLNALSAGSRYDAWLVDEANEHTTALGALSAQGANFTLSFTGNGKNGQPGTNLLGSGNVVEVTQEQGSVQLPTGKVLLSAHFPPAAFVHVRHLLFSFPTTPGKIGLLVGLLEQTRLLNAQALALQSVAGSQNTTAVRCIAQSIIDISEGPQGAHYQPLPATCGVSLPTGDGFGILGKNGYANTAATHASLAATQTDSNSTIRLHASEVEVGTTNITAWVTTIDQDALTLLNNPSSQASVSAISALADHAFHGVDSNGNGQIESIAGEEGAATAYLRGQLMATLTLIPLAN